MTPPKPPLITLVLALVWLAACTDPSPSATAPPPAADTATSAATTQPVTRPASVATPSWPLGFDRAAVTTIQLDNQDDHVVLQRIGTEWLVPAWNNWPAEQHFVHGLLRGVDALDEREPVGFYPLEADHFGFDQSTVVVFRDDQNRSLSVTVGGAGQEPRDAFVRIDDGPAIFKVPAPWVANTHRPTWGSRTVWQVPADLVQRIEWTAADQTPMKLVKTEKHWQVSAPSDGQLIKQFHIHMLPAFAHFRSQGLRFEPNADFKARRPVAQLTITAAEAEMKVTFYNSKDGQTIEGYRDGYPVVYLFARNVLTMPTVSLGGL